MDCLCLFVLAAAYCYKDFDRSHKGYWDRASPTIQSHVIRQFFDPLSSSDSASSCTLLPEGFKAKLEQAELLPSRDHAELFDQFLLRLARLRGFP